MCGYREVELSAGTEREVELCAGTERLNYVRVQTG